VQRFIIYLFFINFLYVQTFVFIFIYKVVTYKYIFISPE
jgi:hypothetical protein